MHCLRSITSLIPAAPTNCSSSQTMSLLHFKLFPLSLPYPNPHPVLPYLYPRLRYHCPQTLQILCAAKRTGKQRYPSEKRKLKLKRKEASSDVKNKFDGIWRLSKLAVSVQNDPGKDFLGVSDGLLQEIAKAIKFPVISIWFLCWIRLWKMEFLS